MATTGRNTSTHPRTPVYHKAKVLYGLDLAKRNISKDRKVVVVEGDTDVMACHLAGITDGRWRPPAQPSEVTTFLPSGVFAETSTRETRASRGEVIFQF